MIKSIFRFFVLGFFVLGFSKKTFSEESEGLYNIVSNIELLQTSIEYYINSLTIQLEDIIMRMDQTISGYGTDAFNIYSDQLQQAIDGESPIHTKDQQLYDEFLSFYDDFKNFINGTSTILDHLDQLPDLTTDIKNDISSIQAEILPFFSSFTFSEDDLNVYDQRVAGLIQELKEQDESLLGQYIEIGEYLREGVDNGVMKLGDIYNKLNSDTSSLDNYLTQSQLEESYDKFLIPNFYQSFSDSKAIPFADYISWSDPTSMDYKESSSFDIKVQQAQENSDGDFFQVLSGFLSNLASLHGNNSRSLVLMTKIMKGEDHKQEEEDLKNDINEYLGKDQEIHQAIDELITILQDSYTTQKSAKFFDLSSLEDIAQVSLPNEINLGSFPMSNIFGVDLTEFKNNSFIYDITYFHPMIEVSRSAFSIFLYLFLGSIAIFIYRLSAPFIFRIIDLLKSSFSSW